MADTFPDDDDAFEPPPVNLDQYQMEVEHRFDQLRRERRDVEYERTIAEQGRDHYRKLAQAHKIGFYLVAALCFSQIVAMLWVALRYAQ